ncbi:hypothetical protein M0R45_000158 [Rubus argutus]|uniref:Uncharacterized protein n=1 Tax=Rubus argutus TaxID=59490 RepID=A0AAW1VQ03_RUBAR
MGNRFIHNNVGRFMMVGTLETQAINKHKLHNHNNKDVLSMAPGPFDFGGKCHEINSPASEESFCQPAIFNLIQWGEEAPLQKEKWKKRGRGIGRLPCLSPMRGRGIFSYWKFSDIMLSSVPDCHSSYDGSQDVPKASPSYFNFFGNGNSLDLDFSDQRRGTAATHRSVDVAWLKECTEMLGSESGDHFTAEELGRHPS